MTRRETDIFKRQARVLKALAANDGVAILIDQHIQAPDAVTVNFFDRPAATDEAFGMRLVAPRNSTPAARSTAAPTVTSRTAP